MKYVVLVLALMSCSKKDGAAPDKAPAADQAPADKPADPADVADVDCEKMTTHNVEVLMKDATAGQSDDEKKAAMDSMAAQHATMVKSCEDEKGTKKLTHKQYDCLLAAQSTATLTACLPKQ